ncbi:methyl-accepting chemotaxis protein [Ectothiorhodospira lacustris]|uniref:methyl-accepting chemotaxis protein n=1 Tax=Ectothiorhodospira lacustris TaxID=2899127 RepID=UPI001EE97A5C|nr:methyl-accepting chemotaxis protein [Ectothiorhodospira lacustris]MCG5508748.1 methyl-accepting chemotaxis protein [Ectothiorhodospira lacustris]MCG5520539.1 methyl-accepting chemotaxis protein [Ectothiorhodospira lacustris]
MWNNLTIRTRLISVTVILLILIGVAVLFISSQGAGSMGYTLVDHTLRMKIEGDIWSAGNHVASEWGALRLVDGKLVDAQGQPINDRLEVVDRLSQELGVLATVFARDGRDFTRVTTSVRLPDGRRAVGTQLGQASSAFAPVSAGQRYIGEAQILGAAHLTVYEPIKDASNQVIGILFLGIPRQQIDAIVSQGVNQMVARLVLGILLLVAGGVVVAVFLARLIVGPIVRLSDALHDISRGEGDLTRQLEARGRDELSDLARAFNEFVGKIRDLVRQAGAASSQLAAAAEQLSSTTEETRGQVRRQHSETDQVATAMNQMTATVHEVSRNASEAAHAAASTRQEAVAGEREVKETIRAIEALAREVENASQVITRLSEDSDDIGKVLEVIRDIAEQTNLLALNAAIEAARAGEQGRGFAVVADEVRTLASRTQTSTTEIQAMIERLQSGASGAVKAMEDGRGKARQSVTQAARAGESLKAISGAVNNINDMNAQIASAAEEQSAVTEEINRNITNIAQAVEQTSSGSDQIALASDELARLAAELQSLVGRFKV